MSAITFQQVIDQFLEGETNAFAGTEKNPGNLRIDGDQIIHYSTPIAERYGDKYLLNITRYSIQTGQVQKKLKASIPIEKRIDVRQVPPDTRLTLKDYIVK